MATFGTSCFKPLVPSDVLLVPTNIAALSSTTITATVGSTLLNQPTVRVLDQHDEPLPEAEVTFAVSAGPAPTPASVRTNVDGTASPTSWQMAPVTGTVQLTASVEGAGTQVFTVTLNPGPAAQADVDPAPPASNDLTATAGSAVANPPRLRVRDQYGNVVPGVAVVFEVVSGGGSIVPTGTVQSDAQGIARLTSWTLGTTAGTNTVRATVAGTGITGNPVTFTASGSAGPATGIVIAPGTPTSQGQTAVANTKVAVNPAVQVRDANGNGVAGVNVRFAVAAGGGKVMASASDTTGADVQFVTTDATGIATAAGWKLGALGSNALTVTIPAVSSVPAFTITATGELGPPASMTILNQVWATTRAGTNNGGLPRVRVVDAGGNVLSGVTVEWVAGNNSTVSGTLTSTTNSSGDAAFAGAWTAGSTVGATMALTAQASANTSASQTFSSTITGLASTIAASSPATQDGTVSTAVAVKPAVLVTDGTRPVPGIVVTFAVTSGGGTVTSATASTDSVGVAVVGSWTLGPTAGSNTLSATAGGTGAAGTVTGNPVTFTATASAGPPSSATTTASQSAASAPVNGHVTATIKVRDAHGNPVSGATVQFATVGTNNSRVLVPVATYQTTATVTTDAGGVASVSWRLDTLAKADNQLAATVTSVTPNFSRAFTAEGVPLAASRIAASSATAVSASPGASVSPSPTVRTTDQYNNAVSGVGVTFTAGTASGTVDCGSGAGVSCSVTTSGGTGVASWTTGTSTGTQTMTATASGLQGSPVTFTATVTAPEWQLRDSLPEPRSTHFAAASGGKIYVAAGSAGYPNFYSSARSYDPATNAWTTIASAGEARSFSATNNAVINGVLYVIAGNPSGTCSNTNEAYTIATNSWASRAAAPLFRCHASAVAYNGRVYVVGGWNASSTVRYTQVDVYDPATNAWSLGTPLPGGTFRGGMAAAVLGDKLYLVGGTVSTSTPCSNTMAIFDFATSTWSTGAAMSTVRCSPAAAVVNGRIYVAGGWDGASAFHATVESYDPLTNSWRSEPSLTVARQSLALVAVGNSLFAIGGGGSAVTRIVEALLVP